MNPVACRRTPRILFWSGILSGLFLATVVFHSLHQAQQSRFHLSAEDGGESRPRLDSRLELPVDLGKLRAADIQVLYDDAVFRLAERTVRRTLPQFGPPSLRVLHQPRGHFEISGAGVVPPGDGERAEITEWVRFEQIGLQPPEKARAAHPGVITISDGSVAPARASEGMPIWLFSLLVDPRQHRIQVEMGWCSTISSTDYLQYRVEEDGRLRYLGYAGRGCAPSPYNFVAIEEPAE